MAGLILVLRDHYEITACVGEISVVLPVEFGLLRPLARESDSNYHPAILGTGPHPTMYAMIETCCT